MSELDELEAKLQAMREWCRSAPSKSREPLSWFFAELDGKVESDITAADIR